MVDDGSTDGSAEIAERYVDRDTRFRLVQPGERRPQRGAQHRQRATPAASSSPSSTATTSLPPNAYELLVGTLDRDRLGLRHRQRVPAHRARHVPVAVPRAAFARDAAEDAHHQLPAAARRPDGLEQAVAPLVLGRARAPLPGGPYVRGHPGDDPAHFLADVRRRDRRARSTSGASARAADLSITQRRTEPQALRDRLPPIQDVSQLLAADGPRGLEALVRRERRRRRPALLPQRAPECGRRVPRAVPRAASTRSSTAPSDGCFTSRCRRSSGSSGTSCGARAAGAARGAALREGGAARHAAGADPRPLVRRLPVPDRRAARDPARVLPARRRARPVFRLNDVRWEGDTLRIEGYAYISMIGAPGPAPSASSWRPPAAVSCAGACHSRPSASGGRTSRSDAAQQVAALDWVGLRRDARRVPAPAHAGAGRRGPGRSAP